MSDKPSQIANAVVFINAYRKFETMSVKASSAIITAIVPEYQSQHLCNSWKGRNKNFGDFFLNLSHATQGDFIKYFKIPVAGLDDFKKAKEVVSMETIFMTGPPTVMWLHELIKYFYNHSVDSIEELELPNIDYKGDRYGCSTNWGKYILSLQHENQYRVLSQLYDIINKPKEN